jgi:hydroxyacylglutathione hydrolase
LRTPRSVDEVVAHRFVFRPQDQVLFVEAVERRSMQQHIERLVRAGGVAEVDPGRYVARGQ